MKTTNPVCIGLIGVGRRTHAVVSRLLKAAAGQIEVTAVYDPDAAAVEQAQTEYGPRVRSCDSVNELLRLPEVAWVLIGSTNARHAEQAVQAMQAGKNVFCEKPLATTLEDCLLVRRVIRETGRIFSFGLVLRYSPHYQKIAELVHGGAIGKLISFEFNETLSFNHGGYIFGNWRRDRTLAGTHLLEKCCHDLDLANWIAGSLPEKVASFGGRNFFTPEHAHLMDKIGPDSRGNPAYMGWTDRKQSNPFEAGATIVDNQVAILQYASGVRATFHTNVNAGLPERRFYLCGSEGTLKGDAYTGKIEWKRIGQRTTAEEIQFDASNGHAGGDEVMAKNLAATILHQQPPLATVEDGLRACVVAFGIDQAMESGSVVDLNPVWQSILP